MPQDERTGEPYFGVVSSAEDAELSRLGAEFVQKHRRHAELVASQQRLTEKLPAADREEVGSLMREKQELAEAIAHQRATTIAGLRVKATVLLAYSQCDLEGQLHWTDHDELLGWSIARDLLDDRIISSSEVRERTSTTDGPGAATDQAR